MALHGGELRIFEPFAPKHRCAARAVGPWELGRGAWVVGVGPQGFGCGAWVVGVGPWGLGHGLAWHGLGEARRARRCLLRLPCSLMYDGLVPTPSPAWPRSGSDPTPEPQPKPEPWPHPSPGPTPHQTLTLTRPAVADVAPIIDRLIIFYADYRVPHEVSLGICICICICICVCICARGVHGVYMV